VHIAVHTIVVVLAVYGGLFTTTTQCIGDELVTNNTMKYLDAKDGAHGIGSLSSTVSTHGRGNADVSMWQRMDSWTAQYRPVTHIDL